MIRPLKILLSVLGGILALFLIWTGLSLFLIHRMELPKATVIGHYQSFQTLEYEPYTIAEVLVKGNATQALDEGARILGEHYPSGLPLRRVPTGQYADLFLISHILGVGSTTDAAPNRDIRIHVIKGQRVLSLQFSGYPTAIKIAQMQRRLESYVLANSLVTYSSPIYVRYTPKYIIPFLQKNEIQVMI